MNYCLKYEESFISPQKLQSVTNLLPCPGVLIVVQKQPLKTVLNLTVEIDQ